MNFRKFLRFFAVVFVVGSLSACSWFGGGDDTDDVSVSTPEEQNIKAVDQKGNVLEIDPPAVVEDLKGKDQIIYEDWLSVLVPSVVSDVGVVLDANIKKKLSSIEVLWSHPKTEQVGSYTLKQFKTGDYTARYNIRARNGNFLPGLNTYEMIGRFVDEGADKAVETYSVSFQINFDMESIEDIQPEVVVLNDFANVLQDKELELEGMVSVSAARVNVYSWHAESGKSTFTRLNTFDPEKRTFQYYGKELFGNLLEGDNAYMIDVENSDGDVIARRHFSVTYKKTTLADTVKEFFGGFIRNDKGWFVSQRYPWFSVHRSFTKPLISEGDESLQLPRPSFQYFDLAKKEELLCDYLGAIDYQKDENVIFKGYSFEQCQTFRYGVSLYERFLSTLAFNPYALVSRSDYKGVSDSVSTAFVMMETPREQVEADLNDSVPQYFVYQLMIQNNQPFVEGQIGDIEASRTDDQRELFADVQNFLNRNTGEEMFGWLFE